MTTLQLVAEAEQHGLTLKAAGDYLDVIPGRLCPPDFAEKLGAHKLQLLALLPTKGVTWIELYSERLGDKVFFCKDEAANAVVVGSGASDWQIYTKAELRTLCAQNRVAPISSTELRKLHEIKRTFQGRIST